MAWYKIVIKHFLVEYLAIILRAGVGYELAIIISYPTSASRIIVLLKTPPKYRNLRRKMIIIIIIIIIIINI